MDNYQQNFLSSLAGGYQFGQQIKKQRDNNQLNQLAQTAYSAPPEQQQALIGQAMGIDRTAGAALEKQAATSEEQLTTSMVNMAKMLMSVPPEARQGLYDNRMLPALRSLGVQAPQWSPESEPVIMKSAQDIYSASMGAQASQNKVIGGALVDPNGRVVYQAPVNTELVDVPDGYGGSVKMIYNPQTQKLQPLGQGDTISSGSMKEVVSPDGQPYRVDAGMSPEDLATAQADMAAGGTAENVKLPDRNVAQFTPGAPRLGYTPPKQKSAPEGYQWNSTGDAVEPIAGGPKDRTAPGADFDNESSLRKEVAQRLQQDKTVLGMYDNVRAAAAQPSAAGDLSMIFAYMKMLDPGSVVREQEFANAQNAASVPDQVRNMYNRALSGQRLNPNQRADFLKQAANLAGNAERRITGMTRQYQDTARQYGFDPQRATGMADFSGVSATSETVPTARPTPPAREQPQSNAIRVNTAADYEALPSGALFLAPDGTQRRKR